MNIKKIILIACLSCIALTFNGCALFEKTEAPSSGDTTTASSESDDSESQPIDDSEMTTVDIESLKGSETTQETTTTTTTTIATETTTETQPPVTETVVPVSELTNAEITVQPIDIPIIPIPSESSSLDDPISIPSDTTSDIPLISIPLEGTSEPEKNRKNTFQGTVIDVKPGKLYVEADIASKESDWSNSILLEYEYAEDLIIGDVVEVIYYDNNANIDNEPPIIIPDSVKYIKSTQPNIVITEPTETETSVTEPVPTALPIDKEEIGALALDANNACSAVVYHDIYVKDVPNPMYIIDDYNSLCNVFRNMAYQDTVKEYYNDNFYTGPLNDYNESFFEKHTLILIKEIRDNSNTKVEIEKITATDAQITVHIKETQATVASNKMGYNLFCLEIPKSYNVGKKIVIDYSGKTYAYN